MSSEFALGLVCVAFALFGLGFVCGIAFMLGDDDGQEDLDRLRNEEREESA